MDCQNYLRDAYGDFWNWQVRKCSRRGGCVWVDGRQIEPPAIRIKESRTKRSTHASILLPPPPFSQSHALCYLHPPAPFFLQGDKRLLGYYTYGLSSADRQEVVVLHRILPSALNMGYQSLSNLVVAAVNGVAIGKNGCKFFVFFFVFGILPWIFICDAQPC